MRNITFGHQLTNYPNSPNFNSVDRIRFQSPTLVNTNLLSMNPSPISTNKHLISKNLQLQISIPMNPRTNHIKSSKFTRIYENLGLSYLDTSKTNHIQQGIRPKLKP